MRVMLAGVKRIIGQFPRLFNRVIEPELPPVPEETRRSELVFSIGIYTGGSPFHWISPESIKNPVLTREHVTDVAADFVADPFLLRANNMFYMFFEVLNRRRKQGEIGLAHSDDGFRWSYQQIVLVEPFHLSYPYVFRWENDYYMTPESYTTESVRLYKASQFPTQWVFVDTLLSGKLFVDPSIFYYRDRWWLFVGASPDEKHDVLCLFYSDNLTGPWREHPRSPIVSGNPRIARPGGRILVLKDRIIRYTQDCYPAYGTQVRAFEITALGPTTYHEREVTNEPILTASGSGWNASGMHHIDPCQLADGKWLACVDGWCRVEIP